MPIFVNFDVMLARRKMSRRALAETAGIPLANPVRSEKWRSQSTRQ